MIKLIKVILMASGTALATGVGAELITNPGYTVEILGTVINGGSKIITLLPLITAIGYAQEKVKKK